MVKYLIHLASLAESLSLWSWVQDRLSKVKNVLFDMLYVMATFYIYIFTRLCACLTHTIYNLQDGMKDWWECVLGMLCIWSIIIGSEREREIFHTYTSATS